MKQYTAPQMTTVEILPGTPIAVSVGGPDDDFNSGLGDWQEGLEQGVRGENHKLQPYSTHLWDDKK